MVRLPFQFLAIYNYEHLLNTMKNGPKYVQNFTKYERTTQKIAKKIKCSQSGEIEPNLVTLVVQRGLILTEARILKT